MNMIQIQNELKSVERNLDLLPHEWDSNDVQIRVRRTLETKRSNLERLEIAEDTRLRIAEAVKNEKARREELACCTMSDAFASL